MNAIETFSNSTLIDCLGWTLVHFLWQGAAIGMLYAGVRQWLRDKSSTARYNLAMIALSAMAVLPIVTFIYLAHSTLGETANDRLPDFSALSIHAGPIVAAPFSLVRGLQIWVQPWVPWTVPLWLTGVCAAMLRILGSWRHAYRLRDTATSPSTQTWETMVAALSALFGITKVVRLAVSTHINVPCVIGWLKPVILIPPSVIAGLTPEQMELILAHELAHIRRHDYAWNILQLAVETLLFYHPVVRWISQQGRLEREKCCDDMVVKIHGDTMEYARALTELESLRQPRSAWLLGANGGQVMERIHRLLGLSTPHAPSFWLPLVLFAGVVISTGILRLDDHALTTPSLFAEKYTLLATTQRPGIPAMGDPASVAIAPTTLTPAQFHIETAPQPAHLRRVHISGLSKPIESIPLPRVGMAESQARAVVTVPRLKPQALAKPSRTFSIVIESHAPSYPTLALQRGIEGSATVEFMLTPRGTIIDIHVTQITGSRLFGQAAMDALRHWKISPATLAGVPVAQIMTEEFIFKLRSPANQQGRCSIPIGYHVCTFND